jgi:D-amino-acid dehydrogenase
MSSQTDVLIIGGGVIGLACAHYLIEAGRGVRIVERKKVGAGASHGNCGLVFVSDLVPLCVPGAVRGEIAGMLRRESPLYIRPSLDLGRILWLLKFAGMCRLEQVRTAIRARESLLGSSERLFDELMRDPGLEAAEHERRGVLMVYRSEQAMRGYDAVNRWLEPYGLQAEARVGRELLELEPALRPEVYGAWYHRIDGHLRPDGLMESWRRRLAEKGVVFEENCELEQFEVLRGRVQAALTSRGKYPAREFVLAAGAWSAPIGARLGIKLHIQPGKGYSITMGRPAVCPAIPCYLHERRVVASPWPSGYRLGGTMEFSGFDEALCPPRIEALRRAAGEYLLEPLGPPPAEEWAGLRPMTYDDLPVIGRAPGLGNLTLATGHGMLGITTAPATGRLVAEILGGRPPHIDPTPFDVTRFR